MPPSRMIRASLCSAIGFSQTSMESSTLLQATRAKSTLRAEVGSASGTTASELRLVETMATQMVRTGEQVSPEVKAELKKLIDESLAASKAQIKASHTADITAGTTVVNNYQQNCLAPFTTSQSSFVDSLAPTGATGLKHSSHKSCRDQWRIDDHDRQTKCDALEAFLSSVRSSAPAALTVPDSRSEMADWWVTIKAFAAQYDTWKSLNDACIAAEGVEDATLADCNTKQGGFEGAMCNQNQAVTEGCEAYDNCYAVSAGDLEAQKTDGLAGAASRKVEWEAIAKIECFVNLLLNEGGETDAEGKDKLTDASLQNCKDLITDTGFLDLIAGGFPVLPDKQSCVKSALDAYGGHPCQQNFLDTSYAGLADTNLATCVACSTGGQVSECDASVNDGSGGWTLVRHVPSGHTWHRSNDQLRGTDAYGDAEAGIESTSEWSIKFDDIDFNEFLFSTGDCQHWLIASKDAVVGGHYSNAPRDIKKSSRQLTPYQARWYRRSGSSEDPWISTIDHGPAIGQGEILYGGNNFGSTHASAVLPHHQGANVWIRFKQ